MSGFEQTPAEFSAPIPLDLTVAGWKEMPIRENGELLVPLGAFSGYADIATSSVYVGEQRNSPYRRPDRQLQHALTTQFVRRGVAEQLRTAQSLLPDGHSLIVFDAYRPLEVQRALYDHYAATLQRHHPDWTDEQLAAETQKYVSLPSYDRMRPSPHNTGGAVDLAIFKLPPAKAKRLRTIDDRLAELRPQAPVEFGPADEAYDPVLRELYILEMDRLGLIRRHGELLDFGTPFDHGDAAAAAAHLERELASRPLNGAETQALHNRRLLYGVMIAAGFQAYPDEWWHFNATQSQMGARTAGLTHAAYGAAHFSQDNREHEIMRTMHRKGLGIIYKAVLGGVSLRGRGAVMDDLVALNELALRRTGDPHATGLPKAAVIEAAA